MYSNNQYSITLNVSTEHAFSHLKCNTPGSFSNVLLAYSDNKENSRTQQALAQVGGNAELCNQLAVKLKVKSFTMMISELKKMQQQVLYLMCGECK